MNHRIEIDLSTGEKRTVYYTPEEDAAHTAAVSANEAEANSPAVRNARIWEQVKALEAGEMMPRPLRDLIKKSLADDAASAGVTLDQLYAMASVPNAPEAARSYKKFKDFDDAILALKRQLV